MENQMNQEIKDIIKKNLPEHVGQVLKERLDLIEPLQNEVRLLKDTATSRAATIDGLENKLNEYKKKDEINASIDSRLVQVTAREYKIELLEAQIRLHSESEKTQFCKEVTLGLVRNIEYRKSAFGGGTTPVMQPGGYITQEINSSHEDVTNTTT